MSTRIPYLLPAVLAVMFVAAGYSVLLHPLVFEKTPAEFTTPFHLDPALYRESPQNATESGISGMQDLIDATGPLVLSIRVRDPETAMQDLQKYRDAIRNMEHLVVTFDMSESEIQDYLQSHQENAQIMKDLLDETSRYDQLNRLEVQFEDGKDPGGLISVIYEQEAIRNRITEMYDDYNGNNAIIESTVSTYALDPAEYENSKTYFGQIVEEVGAAPVLNEQDLRSIMREKNFVSVFLEPGTVYYGDVMKVWGVSRAPAWPDWPVRIYIDGQNSGPALNGEEGRYEFPYTIGRLRTGLHSVYAQDGTAQSEVSTFRIKEVGSGITLAVSVPESGMVTCTGNLQTTRGKPVVNAPVELIWDDFNVVTTGTGEAGVYAVRIRLPVGQHTIRSRFQGDGFPVKPSASPPNTVVVPRGFGPGGGSAEILSLLTAGMVLAVTGAGSVFYLKRRKKGPVMKKGAESSLHEPEHGREGADVLLSTSLIELFLRLLNKAGLREAAFAVYRGFTSRVERVLGLTRIGSFTPRELAARSAGHSFYPAFSEFVPRYEGMRYGPDPESERADFEAAIDPLDFATREDGHE